MSGSRQRLDLAVVAAGLADSRSRAQALIMAGDVLVDDQPVLQPSKTVSSEAALALRRKPRFVSRGGEKLDAALRAFGADVSGLVCADFGASTGGFTDCLLQRGAARVYAVDVGYGQLDARLRDDPRVVVMERVNVRSLDTLPEPMELVVIDVSFISLNLVFPAARRVLRSHGTCIPLIKPQFEAGRSEVGKGGVVKESAVHRAVLERVLTQAAAHGFEPLGLVRSPLTGPAGNVEFLAHLVQREAPLPADGVPALVEAARVLDAVAV